MPKKKPAAASSLSDTRAHRHDSHPQSFAQCKTWLRGNLPKAEKIAVSSNAEAMRRAFAELQEHAVQIKLLGSYPVAVP